MKRAAILALALVATACEEQVEAPAEQGGEAAGEVLGGTISDAMIPLEQLDSEAPLLPRTSPATGTPDEGEVAEEDATEAPGEDAEAAPAAPAPEPSAATE